MIVWLLMLPLKNPYFLFRLNSHLLSPIPLIIHEFVEIYPIHIYYTKEHVTVNTEISIFPLLIINFPHFRRMCSETWARSLDKQ
jgi:hypothetical protein